MFTKTTFLSLFLIFCLKIYSYNTNPIEIDEEYIMRKHFYDIGPPKMKHPPIKDICRFCFVVMPFARHLLETNETQFFQGIATYICESLKIADKTVCELGVKTYEVFIILTYDLCINFSAINLKYSQAIVINCSSRIEIKIRRNMFTCNWLFKNRGSYIGLEYNLT
jgi:hypothetical protein